MRRAVASSWAARPSLPITRSILSGSTPQRLFCQTTGIVEGPLYVERCQGTMEVIAGREVIVITLGTAGGQQEKIGIAAGGVHQKILYRIEHFPAIGGGRYLIQAVQHNQPGVGSQPGPEVVR